MLLVTSTFHASADLPSTCLFQDKRENITALLKNYMQIIDLCFGGAAKSYLHFSA